MPAGSFQPPISISRVTLRPTSVSTGRSRRVSLTTASRYLSSSSESSTRSITRGVRSRRSKAHASPVAVVSWPATTSVTSSSRSSDVAHRRAVLVACREQERQDVVALLVLARQGRASLAISA